MSLTIASNERPPEPEGRPIRRRRSWRRGGSSTARWGTGQLGVSIAALGLAVIAAASLPPFLPARWAVAIPAVVVWALLSGAIVHGLSRSIPRGLFRFRPVDLLYGLLFGILLRLLQGAIAEISSGSSPPIPSYPAIGGTVPVETVMTDVLAGVVVGPLIEELFFRCALLVAVFTVVRRRWGAGAASGAAVALPTVLFVGAHALIAPVGVDHAAALGCLGLVCSLLVVRTGRFWGAFLVHVVYNALLVLLTVLGTLLA